MAYGSVLRPKGETYMGQGKALYDAGKKLEAIRFFHKDYNKKSYETRIKWKDPIEKWMREVMNRHGVQYRENILNNWEETPREDDMRLLRDAQDLISLPCKDIFAQTKYRQPDNGSDILYCLIQPYPGNAEAAREILRKSIGKPDFLQCPILGRDHRCQTQIYATMTQSWEYLRCLDSHKSIKPRIDRVLDEFLNSNAPLENRGVFRASWNRRFELRCFPDAETKVLKVCAYLPPSLFEQGEVQIMEMGEVPDYLFEPFRAFM